MRDYPFLSSRSTACFVDEEGRGSVHARRRPRLHVLVDQPLLLSAVQALVELRRVDPDGLGVALQIRHRELVLVGEHLVVQLPEFTLVLRARARLRRLLREGMEVEGIVAEHQTHLAVVLLHQPLDHRVLAPAVRALEVAELHDGHRSVRRPPRGTLRLHVDARQLRHLQGDLDVMPRLEVVEHLAHSIAQLLLPDGLLDPVLQVVEVGSGTEVMYSVWYHCSMVFPFAFASSSSRRRLINSSSRPRRWSYRSVSALTSACRTLGPTS